MTENLFPETVGNLVRVGDHDKPATYVSEDGKTLWFAFARQKEVDAFCDHLMNSGSCPCGFIQFMSRRFREQ